MPNQLIIIRIYAAGDLDQNSLSCIYVLSLLYSVYIYNKVCPKVTIIIILYVYMYYFESWLSCNYMSWWTMQQYPSYHQQSTSTVQYFYSTVSLETTTTNHKWCTYSLYMCPQWTMSTTADLKKTHAIWKRIKENTILAQFGLIYKGHSYKR